jgi:hypothetical protein
MMQPRLTLALDDHSRRYHPGELLAGQYRVHGAAPEDIRAVELSVLWHTEGKGDEDMSVHFFERVEPADDIPVDLRQPRRFSTVLPNSPLSYNGMIVRICWCVRARVFFWQGRELTLDVPFQLGSIPQPEQAAAR